MVPETDLFNVGNPFVAVYLLKTPIGYIAIDTGFPNGLSTFLTLTQTYGIPHSAIKYFFITHSHIDHVGLLSKLVSLSPTAKIIGTEETFKRLKAGATPIVPGRRSLGWPGRAFQFLRRGKPKPSQFPAVDVPEDRKIVFDGKRQFLRENGVAADILMLPGHTADSIGLMLEDGRLFCGDAAMNGLPGEGRHLIAAENLEEYYLTWDVMIGSKAKWIYPAHGPRFLVEDLVKYRHRIEGREYLIS
jgi:glyoxylase-like metal-dependent hydrolase (beta-lactamase superfamily II)